LKLETKRTKLRRFRMTDLKNMIELESDPEVMKFTPSRLPQSSAQTEKTLRLAVSRNKEREPLGIWAVELKSTGEFVGWFMLLLTQFEVPELGFMIVRRHWRKGLTTEVGERLLKYAFEDLKFPAAMAIVHPENAVSKRVLKKLGFQFQRKFVTKPRSSPSEMELDVFEARP
jgi:RimJ/RimL family protein N-acetyltransferase